MKRSDFLAVMSEKEAQTLPAEARVASGAGLVAVFSPATRHSLPTRRNAARAAAKRQEWLEVLMEHGNVLPVLPGQPLTPEEAPAMLTANADLLRKQLERLSGKAQFQVTLSIREDQADEYQALDRLRGMPGDLGAARDRPGLHSALVGRLDDALCAHAAEVEYLPRADGLAANAVLLVPWANIGDFEAAVEGVDALWPEALRLRIVGPSPGVSFASIAVQRLRAADLDAARRLLGLPLGADASSLSSARSAALRNNNGIAPEAIRAASDMLSCAIASGAERGPAHLVRTWSEGTAALNIDSFGKVA